jgi:hypothetical protein
MSRAMRPDAKASSISADIERIGAFAEACTPWLIAIFVAGVAIWGVAKSYYRPLWFDEILTVLVAKLKTTDDILAACRTGADGQPPLYYLIERASIRVLGNDALGIRLPSLTAYIVFCLSMYHFVARRTSKICGLIAMLIPGTTECWYYATEGRPYAILLGCTGVALVSWQLAASREKRGLGLAALCLSLAITLNIHYYAFLLIIPFAVAELVLFLQNRRADWAMWVAIILPCVSWLFSLPLILIARSNMGTHWGVPQWLASPEETATQFFSHSVSAGLLLLLLIFVLRTMNFGQPQSTEGPTIARSTLLAEGSLAISLALLPVVGVIFATLATHTYVPRYMIAMVGGVCIIAASALAAIFQGRRGPAFLALLVLCGGFLSWAPQDWVMIREERAKPFAIVMRTRITVANIDRSLPIVISNPYTFMESRYYLPEGLRTNIWYLADERTAVRYGILVRESA